MKSGVKTWMMVAAMAALAMLVGCERRSSDKREPSATQAATEDAPRKLRFLLNSGFSGANVWFLLADQRGYFREEGIEVEFVPGRGAFTAAGRMVDEQFDVGYGDIQATYEQAAGKPGHAPVGVYMVMDSSPSVIILPASAPVSNALQLIGKTITGHGADVALNTFEQYASKTGLDPKSVQIVADEGNWKTLIGLLDEHKSDALFGYLSTSSAAIHTAGGKVEERLRFLKYRDAVPELYGSALMVSPRLMSEQPELVRGLVRAVNRGVMETLCEPQAAIEVLAAHDPKQRADVEFGRLMDTIEDMGGSERIARDGVGDIDPRRMQAGLQLTAYMRKLPRQPDIDEVFSRAWLPDKDERMPCAQSAASL